MKVSARKLLDFVDSLPECTDYESPTYGLISLDSSDMYDRLVEFLRTLDPTLEIVNE